MKEKIIIHDAQSTIFDIVKDETTNKQFIKIKTKPPYHNNIFPNVKIIPYTARCSLALKANVNSLFYEIDFIYHLSETLFIVYCSSIKDIIKISNTKNISKVHYLCEDNASIVKINYHEFYLKKLIDCKKLNDFDEIFKILSELTV